MKTTGKLLATILLSTFLGVQLFAGNYEVDNSKSTVKWTGKKVTGQHNGTIDFKSGSLEVKDNKIEGGTFKIDMTTIENADIKDESSKQKLEGHLKSDDFFSVDKYPVSTLVVKKVQHKSGNDYSFTGDLTIKGVTHPVSFTAEVTIGNDRLVSGGVIEVDRTLYDVRYGSGKFFDNLGDNMIYDTFTLDFNVVATETSGTAMLETK
ncbi:Polyisoprenoid-binding protein YceI [Tangfeifania diversioriginum]|uniref:Polyisoprenoid-binding protein YceI n=1 Tax=Tangfeifania diversioriginum TaxID=1168035 RepID=A0A1M6F9W8_9BACT|nr:YceI family protein [Tangfeifania diversioriginum]SHI94487.1 Polyisoprenoid-binding protein YceI [Tangfeifania diversioriginum]